MNLDMSVPSGEGGLLINNATREHSLRRLPAALASTARIWRSRNRSREELAKLDERMAKDIGTTVGEIRNEARKPFWLP
jgi:uncharacterized protein YjiS (DUF1127 family)